MVFFVCVLGEGGTQLSFIQEALPQASIPYPFVVIASLTEKEPQIVYLLLTNGTFFTYLV